MRINFYLIGLCAIFLLVEIFLFNFVDLPFSAFMRELDISHHQFIDFFRSITDFGKSKWYLWPSGILLLAAAILLRLKTENIAIKKYIARYNARLLYFFCAVALSGLITDAIKPILGRARPVLWVREQAYGFHPFSFSAIWNGMPSGHSTTAFCLMYVLWVLVPRGRPTWVIWCVFLAASRVIVNAHYASDVMAGALVGLLTAYYLKAFMDTERMRKIVNVIFPIDKDISLI